MSIDNRRIIFKHLRAHAGHHLMSCTKQWAAAKNVNYKRALREGMTVNELLVACNQKLDEPTLQLITFIEDNDLWDEEKLDAWIETKTPTR